MNIMPKIQIGQVIWWVNHSNKVQKGTVEEYSFCEYQGAMYLVIHSPSNKINNYPCIHYSHCFTSKEMAIEFANYQDGLGNRCDRCKFEHREYNYSNVEHKDKEDI